LAHVVLTAPFDAEYPELDGDAPAATLFELVRRLDARAPGFARAAEERALFAVDGIAVADWSAALPDGAEVLVIARIAGG
jgi:molybdopterin converting factor small subunit